MCGIFGIMLGEASSFAPGEVRDALDDLARLSESRGTEASGFAWIARDAIYVVKHAGAASGLIRRHEYRDVFSQVFGGRQEGRDGRRNGGGHGAARGVIGHARLVTDGGSQQHANNQPLIAAGMAIVHNGIVTNVEDLWRQFPDLKRTTDNDTEILPSLIRKFYREGGDLMDAVRRTFALIEGVASCAVFFEDVNACLLATNNGSLYFASDPCRHSWVFASEHRILRRLAERRRLRLAPGRPEIAQLASGTGVIIALDDLGVERFAIETRAVAGPPAPCAGFHLPVLPHPRQMLDLSPAEEKNRAVERLPAKSAFKLASSFVDEYPRNREAVARLRRCARCILPETMPFIEFDGQGVCNYCRGYKKLELKGMEALLAAVASHRRRGGGPDCLVAFSGGRDSSYGIHFVKTVLKMNPVAYTYDWGMVTDLARRNQMRLCGKLGIEHILVSADIAGKRANIRRNVTAWLRRPDLGTVPLFMAGDKQYFYHANRVGRETGCNLIFLCENLLETTLFKSGFCGVRPRHGSAHTYTLSRLDQIKMSAYYLRQCAANPALINASIFDTLGAFAAYYFMPHHYLNLYQYIRWDEQAIADTLGGAYHWELAGDTTSTWRIGDGTASFYNYIYYTMGGFSEHDTFRSNQIREGMLTRAEALALAERDNQPRPESMQWYCDTIGVDFEGAVRAIDAAPKRYPW